MKRLLASLVCAVIVALVALLWFRPADPSPEEHAPESVTVGTPNAEARAAFEKLASAQLAAESDMPDAAARDVAAVPEPAAAPVDPNTPGVLTVVVVAKETGAPLANTQVQVRDPKMPRVDPGKGMPVKPVEAATTAKLGEEVLTTDSGRVAFEIPPGVLVNASAWSPTWTTSGEKTPVKALAPGEHREVRFELLTRDDGVFHGLVIDRETRAPLANATLTGGTLSEKPHELARTDADGRFRLEFASWKQPGCDVTAPGYATQTLSLDDSAPTPERALVIALERSASLVVTLRGFTLAAGPRPMLVARAPSYALVHESQRQNMKSFSNRELSWRAEFDATLRAELVDLPVGVRLDVFATAEKRELHHPTEPLTLVPRERREVVWTYDPGCKLTVKTLDSDGHPLPFVSLWLLDDDGRGDYLDVTDERSAVNRGKTDAQGVAVFSALAARAWKLGPAVRGTKLEEPDASALAPLATRFAIAPGEREHTLELRLERALYIRGVVLDPDGKPPPKASVRTRGDHGMVRSSRPVDKDGAFVIGPLAAGVHKLRASASGAFAESDEIEVAAGATDVALRLKPGVVVRGRVVDATTGEGCAAHISCTEMAGGGSWRFTDARPDGAFEFGGLTPGRYSVTATARDGRIGCARDLERTSGVDAPELRIAVARGARLHVRFEATEGQLIVEIEHDGVRFAQDAVLPGAASLFNVPAGVVTVRSKLSKASDAWRVEQVTLAAGEERELVIR